MSLSLQLLFSRSAASLDEIFHEKPRRQSIPVKKFEFQDSDDSTDSSDEENQEEANQENLMKLVENSLAESSADVALQFLQTRARSRGRRAREWRQMIEGIWIEGKNFGAVYSMRKHNYVQWFVDGASFMEHAANMMEIAREQIFIAGWHVSPEVHMKRPVIVDDQRWRLDNILLRKAEEGVKIYVLLYKNIDMAINLKSTYTKKRLQNLHENIRVLRHPDHVSIKYSVLKWTHHEKIICIDQNFAYLGGVDLAFGRWDTHTHDLMDLGRRARAPKLSMMRKRTSSIVDVPCNYGIAELGLHLGSKRKQSTWEKLKRTVSVASNSSSVIDYLESVAEFDSDDEETPVPSNLVDRLQRNKQIGRAVGHVRDFYRRHRPHTVLEDEYQERWLHAFKEYWSASAESDNLVPKKSLAVSLRSLQINRISKTSSQPDLKNYLQNAQPSPAAPPLDTLPFLWPGKDYANFLVKDLNKLHRPLEDLIDRHEVQRMPWHDVHMATYGNAARDVAAHFIERWNAVMVLRQTKLSGAWTLAMVAGRAPGPSVQSMLARYDERSKPKSGSVKYPRLHIKTSRVPVPHVFRYMKNKCKVQLLRSISAWTLPKLAKEQDSIHKAYLYLINAAKHYIYIENQFFVSMIGSHQVENNICNALCERITRAQSQHETFRVFIVIPLRPAFEGEIGTESGGSTHAVLKWQYESLFRGKHSLYENLKERGVSTPEEYISICSLRTFGTLGGKLVTELIYIHSKLILIDDRKCIIGSANINDRSMLGTRDTEIAQYISDEAFEQSKMNGKDYKAGRFCVSLRRHLFKEFLGLMHGLKHAYPSDRPTLSQDEIVDPVSEDFFQNIWQKTAKKNAEIFQKVFRCIPNNNVTSFAELKTWESHTALSESDPMEAQESLSEIQGYLVEYPKEFLKNEELTPPVMSKDGLIPFEIFT